MCDTGETLALATSTLQAAGAKGVYAMVSHGLLSGDSIKTISQMPIEKLVVSLYSSSSSAYGRTY